MLDALKKCRKRVVVVGDTHQQIYGFRYATDAMRNLPSDEDHDLTLSFRFGKSVADLASRFIREAKGERGFNIRGNPEKTSSLAVTGFAPRKNCTILSRTNLALFANAMALRSTKAGFRFEKDIDKVLWQTLDVYWLASGEKARIRNEWLQSFEDIKAMEEYAENCEDFQLKGMAQVVRKFSGSFPEIIYEMAGINQNKPEGHNPGDVVLSTVHASKGQEYERVYIDADVADMLGSAEKAGRTQYDEEANIAYVGFTRAIGQLHLSNAFERILSPGWQQYLMNCKQELRTPARIPEAAQALGGKKKSRFTGMLPADSSRAPLFKPPTKKRRTQAPRRMPGVGDRVVTPHGTGVVVELGVDRLPG